MVNDTDDPWAGAMLVRRERLDGTLLASDAVAVTVAPRTVHLAALAAAVRVPDDTRSEVLVVELGGRLARCAPGPRTSTSTSTRRRWTWWSSPSRTATGSTSPHGAWPRTSCCVDRVDPDAVVDDALVTLPAGQSVTFHVRSGVAGLEAALVGPPVLRCANDVVVRRAGLPSGA